MCAGIGRTSRGAEFDMTDHSPFTSAPGLRLETTLVHGAGSDCSGPTVPPIQASSAFAYETAEELEAVFAGRKPGFVYSRIGNPTVAHFERRIATLEQGVGAVAFSSGMAALSAVVLGLAGSGDEVVAGNSLFGGTVSLLKRTLARCGITTRFVEATDLQAYRDAITDRTRLVLVETVGNPKLDVPDIAALATLAHEKGVVLAVDNTAATPWLFQPGMAGADLVLHSASKFISGHGQAIGGVMVDAGRFDWSSPRYAHLAPLYRRTRSLAFLTLLRTQVSRDLGGCLAPFNAFLMSLGVETLAVRMERHGANAARLADVLSRDARVREVRYPGLPAHPDHAVAARQFKGRFGALLTVRLADKAQCFRFINALRLARNLANIGDVRTLVIHPASTFCRELSAEEQRAVGVSEDLVRMSVGIEHLDDILGDVDRALKQLG